MIGSHQHVSPAITVMRAIDRGTDQVLRGVGRRALSIACILILTANAWPCLAQDVTFVMKDISKSTADRFKQEFMDGKQKLESYLASTNFAQPFAGAIDVEVSNGKPFSESLLFVWQGLRGRMYFPSERAKMKGRAAIVHELTHVNAPNEVRFLAEGFPTYLQEKMGSLDVYPTLGDPVECGLRRYDAAYRSALSSVDLTLFDALPTKTGAFLGDAVGLERAFPENEEGVQHRRVYSYLVSASFVRFLIEHQGMEKFKALYALTPLTPGATPQAHSSRYERVFGQPLATLQADWRAWFKAGRNPCR